MGRGRSEMAAVLFLGLAAFLLVVGPAPLDPTNIAWLSHGDAVTNYLGWPFSGRARGAGRPPPIRPMGSTIAGSVMMADANPLLALPFKLLGPWLPTPFQYFGWWLLVCFLLQALFARAIAARITDHAEQRLAIALLFLFAPCFPDPDRHPGRLPHDAVRAMADIGRLVALPVPDLPRRAIAWTVLVTVALLTHPYLLVVVVGFWFADMMRLLLARRGALALSWLRR